MNSLVNLSIFNAIFLAIQGLAALPWLLALGQGSWRSEWKFALTVLGVGALGGAASGLALDQLSDEGLVIYGRVGMSVLHLQLAIDFFLLLFFVLLQAFPKAGAVALAAFQEGVRQPMFWMLSFVGCFAMLVSVYIPYFTFGEDLKMVKELCYAATMLAPVFFGIIAAAVGVSEEIEGRTAVTLLSKPISRQQFLLGKFAGISLAGFLMTLLMGWWLVWVVLYKGWLDANIPGQADVNQAPPAWTRSLAESLFPENTAANVLRGMLLWCHDAGGSLPGLIIGFCHVIVLVSVAVSLATRLSMIVNVVMCFVVYLLGHLAPIITEVTATKYRLVHFVAQLFETLLPGLDLYDVGPAIIRDMPLDPAQYSLYTMNVTIYALLYVAIALVFGLILFEDRDVA